MIINNHRDIRGDVIITCRVYQRINIGTRFAKISGLIVVIACVTTRVGFPSIIGFEFKFNEINIGRTTIFIFEPFIFVRSVSLDARVCVPSENVIPKAILQNFKVNRKGIVFSFIRKIFHFGDYGSFFFFSSFIFYFCFTDSLEQKVTYKKDYEHATYIARFLYFNIANERHVCYAIFLFFFCFFFSEHHIVLN